MVSLGTKEPLIQFHRHDDAPAENACLIQLRNTGPGEAGLFGVLRKHGRAVLRTVVRPLPVELRWVVRDRKVDLQQLRKTHLPWVEADAHGLGMTSPDRADGIVVGRTPQKQPPASTAVSEVTMLAAGAAVSMSGGTKTAASPARPGIACQPTPATRSATQAGIFVGCLHVFSRHDRTASSIGCDATGMGGSEILELFVYTA